MIILIDLIPLPHEIESSFVVLFSVLYILKGPINFRQSLTINQIFYTITTSHAFLVEIILPLTISYSIDVYLL